MSRAGTAGGCPAWCQTALYRRQLRRLGSVVAGAVTFSLQNGDVFSATVLRMYYARITHNTCIALYYDVFQSTYTAPRIGFTIQLY